ncbi:MAG TPA: CoA ester lyase [Solirubrobacterales bacterium]|nr:CoA ester lyase [Solirubrobacterales bacterium]
MVPAPLRSLLFAPADDERKLARLPQAGADAIVLDLEDAVAAGSKRRAREAAAEALAGIDFAGLTAVRVNGFATGLTAEELEAVCVPGLDAVVLPKAESAAELAELDAILAAAEERRGISAGSIRVLPLVETAAGILAAAQIAAAGPRLLTLVLGSGDLAADVGLGRTEDGAELLLARSTVVFAAAAAGLAPAIDGPYFDFRDAEGLRRDSARSRALGFGGRVTIHPGQLEAVHASYSSADPEHLRRVVSAFREAEGRGVAAIEVDGSFVDYPVYRHALRELGAEEEGR